MHFSYSVDHALSFDLNSLWEVTVLSARGSEFQSLGAVTEKDLPPIEDRLNLGRQRSSELEDRSEREGI